MDVEDDVPHVVRHVLERLVAQDAGVVDRDVELAELVHRALDHRPGGIAVGDRAVVGDRPAAGVADLLGHLVGHRGAGARAVARSAQVVDHDRGAFLRQEQRVRAAQTAACACNECNLSVEQTHDAVPSLCRPVVICCSEARKRAKCTRIRVGCCRLRCRRGGGSLRPLALSGVDGRSALASVGCAALCCRSG